MCTKIEHPNKVFIVTILIILTFNTTIHSQSEEIQELYEKAIRKIPERDVFGNYGKPKSLMQLEHLVKDKNLNLETIGFFLYITKPYFPAPIDIIPFASTGGDGCYFAFLTDFGHHSDLETAPILFVSPTDFDKKRPSQANMLFAKNFNDFLTIMTMIRNAEIVRFQEITQMDFNTEVKRIQDECEKFDSGDTKKNRKTLIELLHQNFEVKKIENLNEYYQALYREREKNHFIKTIDGVGIKTKHAPVLTANTIESPLNNNSLVAHLENMTFDEKIKFYREAAYLYHYSENSFLEVLEIISGQMKKDGLLRESTVIDFEVTQTRYYEAYMKARKSSSNTR